MTCHRAFSSRDLDVPPRSEMLPSLLVLSRLYNTYLLVVQSLPLACCRAVCFTLPWQCPGSVCSKTGGECMVVENRNPVSPVFSRPGVWMHIVDHCAVQFTFLGFRFFVFFRVPLIDSLMVRSWYLIVAVFFFLSSLSLRRWSLSALCALGALKGVKTSGRQARNAWDREAKKAPKKDKKGKNTGRQNHFQ